MADLLELLKTAFMPEPAPQGPAVGAPDPELMDRVRRGTDMGFHELGNPRRPDIHRAAREVGSTAAATLPIQGLPPEQREAVLNNIDDRKVGNIMAMRNDPVMRALAEREMKKREALRGVGVIPGTYREE